MCNQKASTGACSVSAIYCIEHPDFPYFFAKLFKSIHFSYFFFRGSKVPCVWLNWFFTCLINFLKSISGCSSNKTRVECVAVSKVRKYHIMSKKGRATYIRHLLRRALKHLKPFRLTTNFHRAYPVLLHVCQTREISAMVSRR